ncbi:YrhK family protein [Lentibacillus jeotgali]|uniref:YrhK family protein n=1 Tax=Lentibacillus jeotgali TaxID=558169 RepID=UPI00026273A8|nr:YrhK family protein [Lentibacillus jeotgali]
MNNQEKGTQNTKSEIDIDIGDHEIAIKKRYELYYNLNDILIAVWFIVGSIFFFWEVTKDAGTWLFLIGSLELLIRPFIRIGRKTHLRRINSSVSRSSTNDQ